MPSVNILAAIYNRSEVLNMVMHMRLEQTGNSQVMQLANANPQAPADHQGAGFDAEQ